MMFNTDKKSQKTALIIVLIGVLLGATILFWKKTVAMEPLKRRMPKKARRRRLDHAARTALS
jgi:hypothetical protein